MGYHQAGFDEIVGVDIVPQPNYPFDFVHADVFDLSDWPFNVDFSRFDLIHASPPCQRYSVASVHENREQYPDLIAPTRALLEASGLPYVIENVEGAPLVGYLKLCGSMFGLQVQRHRYFEMTFPMMSLACNHKAWEQGRPVEVAGNASGRNGKPTRKHFKFTDTAHAAELMGMPWAKTTHEITEAIPPAYTKFIGEAFLAQVKVDVP